ncbi:MAG: hypothetical protein EXS48_00930 [Candidatus Staskawiczbacteria bacterium]|nr:hypothetical protein [Candidatus Staskawiczbacteria bacterium]
MDIKIVKNKYLNALFLLMLFSAIVHMLMLFYFAIISKDLYVLNYFNILDVDIFFPNIFNNFAGNIFSVILVIIIYGFILKKNHLDE